SSVQSAKGNLRTKCVYALLWPCIVACSCRHDRVSPCMERSHADLFGGHNFRLAQRSILGSYDASSLPGRLFDSFCFGRRSAVPPIVPLPAIFILGAGDHGISSFRSPREMKPMVTSSWLSPCDASSRKN